MVHASFQESVSEVARTSLSGLCAAMARRMSAAPRYASGSRTGPIAHAIGFVSEPAPPSATNRKQHLNTKHPTAERNRSHAIALHIRMRLEIDVFIASLYFDPSRMYVHSCSLKEFIWTAAVGRGGGSVEGGAALRGCSRLIRHRCRRLWCGHHKR